MKAATESVRAARPVDRPGDGPRGRGRDALRDEEAPPAQAEDESIGKAAGALATVLGHRIRAAWQKLPKLMRATMVWVGTPLAVIAIGVFGAYDLLGAYGNFQAEALQQARVRVKKLVLERNALRQELEAAQEEVKEAKDQAGEAQKELERIKSEAEAIKRGAVAPQASAPAQSGARAAEAAADATRARGAAATASVQTSAYGHVPTRPTVSMPCDLEGTSQELGAKLKDCVAEFKRRNSGAT